MKWSLLCLLLAATSAMTMCSPAGLSRVQGDTIFWDTFENNNPRWTPFTEFPTSLELDDGLKISATGVAAVYNREPTFSDASIRAQVRIVEGGYAILTGRVALDPIDFVFGWVNAVTNTVGIGIAGPDPPIATAPFEIDPTQSDVVMQLDFFGNEIDFWAWPAGESMPADPLLSIENDSVVGDRAGLWVMSEDWSISGAFEPARGVFRYAHAATSSISSEPCDFDGDGYCGINDINTLLLEGPIVAGVPVTPGTNDQFDLTGDGVIDNADVDQWLADAATLNGFGSPYKRGDANLDGEVDVTDFNDWNANKFTATLLWDDGNFNGDANTDVGDFNQWNANKFTSSDGGQMIPEPTAALLMVIQLAALAILARHTKGR